MKLIIMLFSPISRHFISLRSKYSAVLILIKNANLEVILEKCVLF
jgi:hypothetical protein